MIHLGAAAALGPVGAILEAESAATPVHIEPLAHPDCPYHHEHLFCQLVRSPAFAGVPRDPGLENAPAPPVRQAGRTRESSLARSSPIMSGSIIPRGPPIV